jgi:peptidoglycan-associated lipoprotein
MNTTHRILAIAALALLATACSKQVKETPPPVTDVGGTTTAPVDTGGAAMPGAYTPPDLDSDACLRQRVINFDFDQYAVKPEYSAVIACHAKYLRDRPSARMTLEGNTDERGTREYNLGLGERRGNAVSSALQAAGASAGQITVVSYGEERPLCTDSTEACWAQNRRVEIVYTAK